MSAQNRFSDEFKKDAVSQIVDRGYLVAGGGGTARCEHEVDLHMEGSVSPRCSTCRQNSHAIRFKGQSPSYQQGCLNSLSLRVG